MQESGFVKRNKKIENEKKKIENGDRHNLIRSYQI